MRVGLLADIHGNADALKAVLSAARQLDVSLLMIAGDFVGYYYEATEVFKLLSTWEWIGVRGNHENAFRAARYHPEKEQAYSRQYGSAFGRWQATASESDWQILDALPETIRRSFGGYDFLLAHGAPWDADEYIYPDAASAVWHRLSKSGAEVVVLGHTHYQFARREGGCIILNPGSVGQPRDRRPGAPWILLDTEVFSYSLRRESYDTARVVQLVRERDPQLPYLEKVLVRT